MNPHFAILLTATSQTHTLVVFLSICILIFSAGLIEGLIKGRFLGGSGVSRQSSPVFYYLRVALLVYLIVQFSLFLKELIHQLP